MCGTIEDAYDISSHRPKSLLLRLPPSGQSSGANRSSKTLPWLPSQNTKMKRRHDEHSRIRECHKCEVYPEDALTPCIQYCLLLIRYTESIGRKLKRENGPTAYFKGSGDITTTQSGQTADCRACLVKPHVLSLAGHIHKLTTLSAQLFFSEQYQGMARLCDDV